MVFTLHRYIFRDLLKTFCLATLLLSLVLGLGFMLRPLRHFNVNPADVPTLILYTLPITLTMVIPIAALLAATVNYGRLAVDNEISACRASGIGLLTLIYPAFFLALLVGISCLILAFHVIPDYTKKFEKLIAADAESIIYRNIEKKGHLGKLFPGIHIHADRAIPEQHRLCGVAVLILDRSSRTKVKKIDRIITAKDVVIDLQSSDQPDPAESHNITSASTGPTILLHLYQASMIDNNRAVYIDRETLAITPPSLWRDDIKFKKLEELKNIQQDMTLFAPVRQLLQDIRRQCIVEDFFRFCARQLKKPPNFLDLYKGADRLRLYAQDCKLKTSSKKPRQKTQTAYLSPTQNGLIELKYFYNRDDYSRPRQYLAQSASIFVNPDMNPPSAILILENLNWNYLNDPNQHPLLRHDITNLTVPAEIVSNSRNITLAQALLSKISLDHPSPYLQSLFEKIRKECNELAVEIRMEKHSRLAFGISCVVLVLLGAALGIVFRSSHLLTAFGVSFIPAAFCLITIFTGKHIAEQSTSSTVVGIMFLWSGIALVAVANFVIYKKLLKH